MQIENYQIKIQNPSGEIKSMPLKLPLVLGANPQGEKNSIKLSDSTLCDAALRIDEGGWIKVMNESLSLIQNDFFVRETKLLPDMDYQIGNTHFSIENKKELLVYPPEASGTQKWETHTQSGLDTLWFSYKSSQTDLSVYLHGETGTGKEVLAKKIHAWSKRKSAPFAAVNCGALPLGLAESELFGHTKGAFTGASHHRPGAFLQAHHGTLFLDEICDLSPEIQVKLLRFLESGEIKPVGSDQTSKVNVRVICASHKSLPDLVKRGLFREDLYYRLASLTVKIPALRERPEDIESLAKKFCENFSKSLSKKAIEYLCSYTWPGNVRELKHAIERACGFAELDKKILLEKDFDFLESTSIVKEVSTDSIYSLKQMEKILLLKALKLHRGNRQKAAKTLGVARSTLFEMLKRHQIRGPRSLDA